MIFRLDRFFFDEKDVFTFLFGVFLLGSFYLSIPLAPFKFPSLVVLFFYLIVTRTMKSSMTYQGYFFLTLLGLIFSLFLSPYGLAVYLLIASLLYGWLKKM